jgi:predicted membrane-bound mannosyltransferase
MLPAGATVGPVDLDHPHLLIKQVASQAGTVAAGTLHANHTDLAVAAKPAQQLPVAATVSPELLVAEQPSLGPARQRDGCDRGCRPRR